MQTAKNMNIRTVLIDDDQLVCMSLKTILETDTSIHVAAVGNDGSQALSLYKEYMPDVLLMDIRMQNMNGTDALETLLKEYPDAKVLFLTTFLDDAYIVKALELGAKGYIVKQKFEQIIPAIKAIHAGQNVYGDEIISKIPELLTTQKTFDYTRYDISEKEYEIIKLVADGRSNKEIASNLYLSEGTVRNYLSSILEKLGLRDRTQLAVFYYQHQ